MSVAEDNARDVVFYLDAVRQGTVIGKYAVTADLSAAWRLDTEDKKPLVIYGDAKDRNPEELGELLADTEIVIKNRSLTPKAMKLKVEDIILVDRENTLL